MISDLRMLQISDIHLGHDVTVAADIIQNLRRDLGADTLLRDNIKLIWFVGDVFDRLLSLPVGAVNDISVWINSFLRDCKMLDITVRVLEGTPSHDWRQSRIFESENYRSRIGCDVVYVERLSIEYIPRFDINVLYVPDEHKPDTDDTWRDVCAAMAERGLTQVDFSLVHGTFEHQLPAHIKAPKHINERYLSITRYIVMIGHVHKHSVFDRIVSTGSYDRIAHGEEYPKGHVRYVIRESGDHDIIFVENIGAAIFKSINCVGLSIEASLSLLTEYAGYPLNANFRILAARGDAIISGMDTIRKMYPLFNWKIKVESDHVNYAEVQKNIGVKTELPPLNKDSLLDILSRRISANSSATPSTKERALKLLNDFSLT